MRVSETIGSFQEEQDFYGSVQLAPEAAAHFHQVQDLSLKTKQNPNLGNSIIHKHYIGYQL